jgi:hypothetical protein
MFIKQILTLLITVLFVQSLLSQVLEFQDIEPSWSYPFKEKSSSNTNNYINIFDIVEKNGKYFIVGASEEPYYRDWYGATLACLDQNGNEEWYTAYQTFENNDSIHVFFPNFTFNQSEIQLFGYRRKHQWTDTPGFNDAWNYYWAEEMYPHDITIDLQSGDILEICKGEDTIKEVTQYNFLPTFKNEKGQKFKTTNDVYFRPDSAFINDELNTTLGFNYYAYNDSCSFMESNIIDTLFFLPNDTVGRLSIEMHPKRIQPDQNTLLLNIWFERYSNDPRQYLLWMDISDINNVQLIEMQELLNYIPRSTERWIFFRFNALNEQVVLSHRYKYRGEITTYLLWLNNEREIKKVIAPCHIDNHQYSSMNLLHATDKELLCLGFPSKAPNRGYDLLRVTEEEDSLVFIKSIVPQKDNIYYNYLAGTVSESGEELILGMYVFQYENETIFNARQEVHAFRLSDLTSSTTGPLHTSRQLKVYPNPANTITRIENKVYLKHVEIMNVSGQEMPIKYQAGNNEINVAHLPAGLYFIHAQDREGMWYQCKLIKQ